MSVWLKPALVDWTVQPRTGQVVTLTQLELHRKEHEGKTQMTVVLKFVSWYLGVS